jgi:hypothetical protein
MARVDISNLKNSGDIAMVFNWEMKINTSGLLIDTPSDDIINIRCTDIQLPEPAIEDLQLNVKSFKIELVGRPLVKQEFTATFFDTIDNGITEFLYDWNREVSDPVTGVQAPLDDVRADITVTRFDRQWETPLYQYNFIGAHLHNYKGLNLTSSGNYIAPVGLFKFVTYKEKSLV